MELSRCEKLVKEALDTEILFDLYNRIQKSMEFKVECEDSRNHENSNTRKYARAYFTAPNINDTNSKSHPKIVVCANEVQTVKEIREVLTHELVHAYDHCVRRIDLTNPDDLACSEIRAAREAECKDYFPSALCDKRIVNPNDTHNSRTDAICLWFQRLCIRKCALRSLDPIFPSQALSSVNGQFDACTADREPFQSR